MACLTWYSARTDCSHAVPEWPLSQRHFSNFTGQFPIRQRITWNCDDLVSGQSKPNGSYSEMDESESPSPTKAIIGENP